MPTPFKTLSQSDDILLLIGLLKKKEQSLKVQVQEGSIQYALTWMNKIKMVDVINLRMS